MTKLAKLKQFLREAIEDGSGEEARSSSDLVSEITEHLERASELIGDLANLAIASTDGPSLVERADNSVTRALDAIERADKMGYFADPGDES